jgi:peptidoglycan/xylan/chitin deacetylase (PgdA/CDA1 family)
VTRNVFVATLIAALVLGAGCGTSDNGTKPPSTTRATSTTVAPNPTTTVTTTTSAATTTTTSPPPTVPTTTTTPATVPHGPADVVRHGDEHRRWIALTFDAGSDVGNTPAILDLLAAHHVRASFSLTGTWARANPTLVRRIARDGHVIVNHTDTHRSFTGFSTHSSPLSAADRIAELERADTAIMALTGHSTRPWMRPPYGDIDASTPADVARAGYRHVLMWTVDSLGWKGLAPAAVAARCLAGATPGGIVLLHVGSQSTDAAALPAILDGLRARGYDLVSIATPGFVS